MEAEQLRELKEEKRQEMVKTDMPQLNLLATLHNLIGVIENKQWERLPNKMYDIKCAYNYVIENLNSSLSEVAPKEEKEVGLGLIRYDKEKPPKNKTVLFVYWHRNGIETSQKCCGFITDSGKLITDLKFYGSDKPTFWKELF